MNERVENNVSAALASAVSGSEWRDMTMVSFQSTVKVRHTPKMACPRTSTRVMVGIYMSSSENCYRAGLQLNSFLTTF